MIFFLIFAHLDQKFRILPLIQPMKSVFYADRVAY